MTFAVRWPDGRVEECYSPSLVMHDFLDAGKTYTVADFTARSTQALDIAGERVLAKFGFACTSSVATQEQITRSAAAFEPDDRVAVIRMYPPLPPEDR